MEIFPFVMIVSLIQDRVMIDHSSIMPELLAANGLTGCDTVAHAMELARV